MYVICTAGHVDHGKSTIVEALSGIDPDRLLEEKDRQMTIDLGFAWTDLPDLGTVGIIDVPGHKDFIRNMLAGVSTVSAVLLIVAADEGVMPQTDEHIAILDLLDVKNGIVILTKTDLVEQSEWIDLVRDEVCEKLLDTSLAGAHIINYSVVDGRVSELKDALVKCLDSFMPKLRTGIPRVNIDRVFTLAGFGTVITGTLQGGSLKRGEEIEIMPGGLRGRIRGLQTYNNDVETVLSGNRVAVNLSGIDKRDVSRGSVLSKPGNFCITTLVDVSVRMLDLHHNVIPLRNNEVMKVFVGTSELMGTVRIIGSKQLMPGDTGWLQIVLHEDVVVEKGDKYILRRPSPSVTVGGGIILNDQPNRRYRLNDQTIVDQFRIMTEGSPSEVIVQHLESNGMLKIKYVFDQLGFEHNLLSRILGDLIESGKVIVLGVLIDRSIEKQSDGMLISKRYLEELINITKSYISDYHNKFPLRRGIPREELKSKLYLDVNSFNLLIDKFCAMNLLLADEAILCFPDHTANLSDSDAENFENIVRMFESDPYNPPSMKQVLDIAGSELFSFMISQGILISINSELVFLIETYNDMLLRVKSYIADCGSISVAEFRDLCCTSRKYALGFLEHLDSQGITIRIGDRRKLV